ncbi:histidine kinase N-terminal domain-containing protein [Desulfotruncus alcoholivorax]|uniref:histidine kinase N-terminal domain-containing protein n=1 Tax=Desulfotruncus alcoholivorax TaxID=265477 RepID=UPI0003FEE9A4|nr:histidine kinase N-terminal domain-containing protein [Desulfotruncus alcoholivorax]
MASVHSLCKQYTSLDNDDIYVIEQLSNYLKYIADLTRADVFIDVLTTDDEEALVVAEANPTTAPSLYTQSVVGELAFKKNEPAVFNSFETSGPVWEVKGVTQQGISVKQSVIPVKGPKGNVVATLIMEQDISEQIQTVAKVELLSETTEKLTAALLDVATVEEVLPTILQDAVIITNRDYTVLYANPLAQQLLQTSNHLITGKKLMDVIRDMPATNELVIDNRVYILKHVPIKKSNQLASHIFMLRDVTELHKKEKELMAKAAVIKEIHHRVKNNLHTVAGLLRLQMRRSDSEQVKKALSSSINRISSIALIHEALTVKDIHYVDLLPLIEKVVGLSIQTGVDTEDMVTVRISGMPVQLPSEIATGTAMVLNELIQNSLEHGFAHKRGGSIYVFKTGFTTSGFPYWWAFLLGLLQAQWTFTGYDASAHTTEETINPRVKAAWGVYLSVLISAVFGYIMLFVITSTIGNAEEVAGATNPFIYVVEQSLGGVAGRATLWMVTIAMWFCGLSSVTSNSRMIFAFARDGGMPKSELWSKISKTYRTPAPAIWLSVAVAFLIAVYSGAYSVIVSISTIGLYVSYGIPLFLKLRAQYGGKWKEQNNGPWNLGKWSKVVNTVGLIWIFFICILFVSPPNQLTGYTLLGMSALLVLYYLVSVRKWFKGPSFQADSQKIYALEHEFQH